MAERAGFEPANLCGLHAFQACALSQTTRPLQNQAGELYHDVLFGQLRISPRNFQDGSGNVITIIRPLPISLSARICPLWAWTMDLAIASPRPEPPSSRVREASAR